MLLEGILKPAWGRTSIVVMQRLSADGDSVHNFVYQARPVNTISKQSHEHATGDVVTLPQHKKLVLMLSARSSMVELAASTH